MVEHSALGGTQAQRQHAPRITGEDHALAAAFTDNTCARLSVRKRRDDLENLVERCPRDIKAAAKLVSCHAILAGGVEGLHDVDGARESLLAGEFTHGHARAPSFR